MRKDLIIGVVFSLLLHGGVLGWDKLFHLKHDVPQAEKVEEEKLVQMEMPPPDEPDKEEVKELQDEPVQNQMAPPSLADIPSINIQALQQPMAPPPPPGLATDKNAITVPVIKPGSQIGRGMKDLFNIGDLDQLPQPIARPKPDYPYEMKRAGIAGVVEVEYIIDSNGNVSQVQVIKSSQREFEEPVIRALLRWRYRPGKKGGRVVNTRVSQSIPFTLSDD
jgi:protein TonB